MYRELKCTMYVILKIDNLDNDIYFKIWYSSYIAYTDTKMKEK